MADRDKVIKGLELCSREPKQTIGCLLDCPYEDVDGCRKVLMRDALALLKAQEPVAPVRKSFLVSAPDEYGATPSMTVCGACGAWLLTVEPRAKYCPNCGRAVKWE